MPTQPQQLLLTRILGKHKWTWAENEQYGRSRGPNPLSLKSCELNFWRFKANQFLYSETYIQVHKRHLTVLPPPMIMNHESQKAPGDYLQMLYTHASPDTTLSTSTLTSASHLEYASEVWNLYKARETQSIENIQKFSLRIYRKTWDQSYQSLFDFFFFF